MTTASPFDLSGRVAVVTGSSRGIGRATAVELARAGARVVVSSRKADACEAAASAIREEFGAAAAIAVPANVGEKAQLERLAAEAEAQLGPVDILVCNAAANPYLGPMAGIADEQFLKVLTTNVVAAHWLVALVAPGMVARRRGAIVLTSSVGGLRGSDVIGAYNVSKAAEMQLARNLAIEFGPAGVRVNCVAPGLVRTDFARALWEDAARLAAFEQAVPVRRMGEPADIAGAILFLVSDAARYVTGQTLVVDGGLTVTTTGF